MEKLDQNSLNTALWAAADEMRKTMSADVYKNFLLPLVFYKNLSDRMLYEAADLLEDAISVAIITRILPVLKFSNADCLAF